MDFEKSGGMGGRRGRGEEEQDVKRIMKR